MNASQYPVTFGFGAVDGRFYGPNGSIGPYHLGEDRSCKVGTPVMVNGHVIGLTGNTGLSGGPHLHIGRWVSGRATNPKGGGFTLNNAKVVAVGEDAKNGKYVKIQDSAALWVYLHLSEIKVKAGAVLTPQTQGDDEVRIGAGENWYNRMNRFHHQLVRNGDLSREIFNRIVGQNVWHILESWSDHPEADQLLHFQRVGEVAHRDKWDQQIYGLQGQVSQLRQQAEELAKRPTQAQIDALRDGLKNCEESVTEISDKASQINSEGDDKPDGKPSLFVKLLALIMKLRKT